MKWSSVICTTLQLLICNYANSQLENAKWYFGNKAGLDFVSGAPSALINASMTAIEAAAVICDSNGNLLFYTSGDTIWNQSHQIMANGTGLLGHKSATQGALIVKKPGSNILYYVFTVDAVENNLINGFRYSIVDMSLAAGQGSVTSKNILIYGNTTEKLTGVRHCNGTDYWIVTHEMNTNNFRSYLLSSSGLSNLPMVSSVGIQHGLNIQSSTGQMKISPLGNKLGLSIYLWVANSTSTATGIVEVFDFNSSTGSVSNSVQLSNNCYGAYGCEFSPDGSKFYVTQWNYPARLIEWDLCAGNSAAIAASQSTLAFYTTTLAPRGLQLGIDGKIYGSVYGFPNLVTLDDPNQLGFTNNYNSNGPFLSGRLTGAMLPNMITKNIKQKFTFTQDLSCSTVSFSPPAFANPSYSACFPGAGNYNLQWNFGEPSSGAANTSTLPTPAHSYSALGTYTVKLKWINSVCNNADSVIQTIALINPTLTVQAATLACNGTSSATLNVLPTNGALTYTWFPSNQNTQVATGLSAGTYTVFTKLQSGTCVSSMAVTVNPTGNISLSSIITASCTSSSATLAMIGGSGSYSFLWSPGAYTTSTQSNLPAGLYTVQVNDTLNHCLITKTLSLVNLASPSITVTGNFTVCAGGSNTLQANGANTYSWSNGIQNNTAVYTPSANTVVNVVGTNTNNLCASTKTLLIYYSKCVGINEDVKEGNALEVYPNPASTEVFVKIESTINFAYEIIDASGKSLQKGSLTKSTNRIALKDVPNGIYLLNINQEERLVYSGKVVVEK